MLREQLFAEKSLKVLLDEMAGEHRLRRVLGPVALSSLGIGAIIGTGIFVLTGLAARNYAGPGLILSYVIAGLACAFAALCYAEFASMAPVAGSAYTYAYTTLGELMAWIIGWDLVLEYAMGSATVANGWSHYFFKFLACSRIRKPAKRWSPFPCGCRWTLSRPRSNMRTTRPRHSSGCLGGGWIRGEKIRLPVDFHSGEVKVSSAPHP